MKLDEDQKNHYYITNIPFISTRNELHAQIDMPYTSLLERTNYSSKSYANQKNVAYKILRHFKDDKAKMVSLIAPPQWGKTGTFIEVIGRMCDADMSASKTASSCPDFP